MQVSIKNVDEKIFRDFRAEAVREKMQVGKVLTLAMKHWIEKKQKKPKLDFLTLKPTSWGKGTERTSEQIDEILYG
ncbi:hypothetical protein HZC31_07345 [Candidatus Woesearchaeota archaeon]|nr:hypothetical protein [Candidatus Woesearchaeota archaeon]